TIGERLTQTIHAVETEKYRYDKKAQRTGLWLNIAIGLQVLLEALTIGISAATSGKQVSSKLRLASPFGRIDISCFLSRSTRGSNEPQLSITRAKDPEQFLRECGTFNMDHEDEYVTPGEPLNNRLEELRQRFEERLGNADG
ncbi:uncharacterized protein EDB91DRAFT_1062992, partial [Suillus paluster]|uniref:uncharacterized protein n=1 Tax=Suillus paluster TaxID=48578 RepID=UPI001B86B35C